MAETEARPTLCFTASFPLVADFAPTVGELATRLATFAGVGEDEAITLGRSVEAAFTRALNGQSIAGALAIEVSLCAGDATVDFSVSCGSTSVLALSHPRPQ